MAGENVSRLQWVIYGAALVCVLGLLPLVLAQTKKLDEGRQSYCKGTWPNSANALSGAIKTQCENVDQTITPLTIRSLAPRYKAMCSHYQATHGYALLQDIHVTEGRQKGPHYLLIPSDPVSGIEQGVSTARQGAEYWQAAIEGRAQAEAFLKDVRLLSASESVMGMAINSKYCRTQQQLHIHLMCLKKSVRDILQDKRKAAMIQQNVWSLFPVPLEGQKYKAIRVSSQSLTGHNNPFTLLGKSLGSHQDKLPLHTLVVVPDGNQGFIVLTNAFNPKYQTTGGLSGVTGGHGEDLLDPNCNVANE